jgi:hypothetical protein
MLSFSIGLALRFAASSGDGPPLLPRKPPAQRIRHPTLLLETSDLNGEPSVRLGVFNMCPDVETVAHFRPQVAPPQLSRRRLANWDSAICDYRTDTRAFFFKFCVEFMCVFVKTAGNLPAGQNVETQTLGLTTEGAVFGFPGSWVTASLSAEAAVLHVVGLLD